MTTPVTRRLRGLSFVAVLLLALANAACGARGASTAGGEGIRIEVSNNLVPALTVSTSAAIDGTTPVRIGTLVGGATQTFTFRPQINAGSFRLVADRPGPGGSLVSEPIPLPAGGTGHVEWELGTNNIIVH